MLLVRSGKPHKFAPNEPCTHPALLKLLLDTCELYTKPVPKALLNPFRTKPHTRQKLYQTQLTFTIFVVDSKSLNGLKCRNKQLLLWQVAEQNNLSNEILEFTGKILNVISVSPIRLPENILPKKHHNSMLSYDINAIKRIGVT